MVLHRYFINAAHFIIHYLLLIFPTAALAIQQEWRLSYAETLRLGTAALIVFALATLPVGWLGDRLPRNYLMGAFFVGSGIAAIVTGFASGAVSLVIGLSLIGLFAAIYHPVGLAMISDLSDKQGIALAVNGVWGNLGLAGAAIATGFLTTAFGWRMAFLLPGIVTLAIGCFYLLWFSSRKAAIPPVWQEESYVALSTDGQLRILLLVAAAALFGGFIFNGVTMTMPKVLEERLSDRGVSLQAVGVASAIVFGVAAFSQLPVGRALDRFGARPVLLILLAVQGTVMLALSTSSGITAFALAVLLTTAIFAEIPVTSWLLARFVASQWRARAYSLEYLFSLGVSSAIIPVVAALHAGSGGFDLMFVVLAGAAAVVWCVALLLPTTTTKGRRA